LRTQRFFRELDTPYAFTNMLEIDEALRLVLDQATPLAPSRPAVEDALGLVLAEPIVSDIDSPPHDKSIVDGYALLAADIANAGAELTVLEEITAGQVPTQRVVAGAAARIMTGAPLPEGADSVVMVEKSELLGTDRVRILQAGVKPGQNIMRRASSLAKGQTVLEPGAVLRAIELGLLAEVGRAQVSVVPRPRVAILATGNELVPCDQAPGPGQIRNSNGIMLAGLVAQAGGEAVNLGIGRDTADDLRALSEQGLQCDVLVISGGVSAGVLDLVPAVMESLGVEQVFHKVNLKPGKPLWFGVKRDSAGQRTLVFGLPGNPVSGLVCFELFVRPAMARLMGLSAGGLERVSAKLAVAYHQRGDRVTMFPAALRQEGADLIATPLNWRGSGDLRTLTEAQGLIHFPAGERQFAAGEEVSVLRL
jgi:molybdopterin molybdotransferase